MPVTRSAAGLRSVWMWRRAVSHQKYQIQVAGKKVRIFDLIKYYETLIAQYPIVSIEDGLAEDDWEGWRELTDRIGRQVQVVGDDLCDEPESIGAGHSERCQQYNPGQTQSDRYATETIDVVETANKAGYAAVVSHRSERPKTRPFRISGRTEHRPDQTDHLHSNGWVPASFSESKKSWESWRC